MTIKEKANQLLNLGYDDDIISITLGISIQDIEIMKKQIQYDKNEKTTKVVKKSKLQMLREIYNKIYCSESPMKVSKIVCLSKEQILEIQSVLDEVEPRMRELLTSSSAEQSEIIKFAVKKLSPLENLYLPLDLAERIYKMFPEVKKMNRIKETSSRQKLVKLRNIFDSNFYNAISNCIKEEDTIEGLNNLLCRANLIRPKAKSSSSCFSLQNKIQGKIQEIKAENNKLTQLLVVTDEIRNIVRLITNEQSGDDEIERLIIQEAQKYLDARKEILEKKNNSIALKSQNIERARIQINHIIKKVIIEDENIINIDSIYKRLISIFGSYQVSAHIIIENLVLNGRFEEANDFIDRTFEKSKDPITVKLRRQCRIRIRSAQIADYVMKGINAPDGSISDEDKYYQMITEGINNSIISPSMIILGQTKDGLKTITWEDLADQLKFIERTK